MIHITDGQTDQILDVITVSNIISDKHRQSLKDNLETFDFTTFSDKRFSQHLAKRNRIIIPGEDGELREFTIHETLKGLSRQSEVYASASYLELKKAKVIYPQTTNADSAEVHVSNTLSGTEWQPGNIAFNGVRTLTIENHTNPFAQLKRIASEFDLELRFRVEVSGSRVIGRYVDLVERVGRWRGREVTFGKDLVGIKRREKTDKIVTALLGLGPVREDGTRLEVFVEDKDALARWGRNGQHLIETYEPQSTDQNMTESRLRSLTENELEKRVKAALEYESNIADLEYVPGMENKKIRFGDTIKIKDTKFNPPLYLEARVHTQERSIVDQSNKKVTLGDFIEYTEEEVTAIWKSLQKQVAFKIGQSELADYTYTKTKIDDKDSAIYTDSTSYAYNQAQTAQSNAETYAYNRYENTKTTVENNAATWDKAGVFNADGTLNVDWLSGLLTDDQIASAGTWNAQGTYIDETGVYTGTILANQVIADNLSAISANLGTVTAGTLKAVTLEGVTGTFSGQLKTKNAIIGDGDGSKLNLQYTTGRYIRLEGNYPSDTVSELKIGDVTSATDTTLGQFDSLTLHTLDLTVGSSGDGYITAGTIYSDKLFANNGATIDGDIVSDGALLIGGSFTREYSSTRKLHENSTSDNNRHYFAPTDDNGNWNWGREFGYDWNLDTWYVDNALRVSASEILSANGYFRLRSKDGQHNGSIIINRATDEISFYQNGAFRHSFNPDGSKAGGSIDVDGQTLGMSPIDSPQILLEYVEFDVPITSEGTKIYLDPTYLKTVENFAAFPNNGKIVEKGIDYVVISGEGIADIRFIGERIGYAGAFYSDMNVDGEAAA
ncbi:phage tail spike protein [Salinibacillus xinjiangensis]|uniref:Tail spike domain-containing protein n=1 Tax=Salinibacillus xinjiangensis TaxID=1229268 RepID=A0A6G1X808_9BACI|nr:phage tail spike protein [Salinibacillus xinjiangensis]MRG87010.1 hypothetical protein [Salinibacillus xinjiangensis]